jgi:chemotaxis protein MotB
MRRAMMALAMVAIVVALMGCSGAKQLKKQNLDLTAQIDSLNGVNTKLAQDIQSYEATLKQKDAELQARADELKQKEAQASEQNQQFAQMQAAMKAEVDAKQVTIQELEGQLTVSMVEAILFDSGKAVVKKAGAEALKKVAEVLKTTTGQNIIVAGYTDNVPISSKLASVYPSNWELSAARAIAVVKILEADGVDPKLLGAVGYGEYRPVADNSTPEGRAQNRRMEIILMPKRS